MSEEEEAAGRARACGADEMSWEVSERARAAERVVEEAEDEVTRR